MHRTAVLWTGDGCSYSLIVDAQNCCTLDRWWLCLSVAALCLSVSLIPLALLSDGCFLVWGLMMYHDNNCMKILICQLVLYCKQFHVMVSNTLFAFLWTRLLVSRLIGWALGMFVCVRFCGVCHFWSGWPFAHWCQTTSCIAVQSTGALRGQRLRLLEQMTVFQTTDIQKKKEKLI